VAGKNKAVLTFSLVNALCATSINVNTTEVKGMKMILELARPKNALTLVAGVTSIFFEKVAGITPPAVNGEGVHAQDDLTIINGIGPTFAKRLNDAGIYTYADLAELDPDFVRLVARVETWQGDPAAWIAEAKTRL
jgi:hypothetical protein